MSDSPRPIRRHPNRLNRAHAYESLDPTLTRKGVLSHPGSLLTGVAALAFFAYVFNVAGLQTFLDGFFGGMDSSARTHNDQVATWVVKGLPYLGIAVAAVVVIFILMSLGRGAKTMTKRRKLSKREEVSLEEFIESAKERGISKKVAREAYDALLPHYDHQMRVTLSDRMTTTLHMKPVEITDLYTSLLRNTDRQRKVGDTGSQIDTVMDLLKAVEESTPRSLTQSKLYQRAEREAGYVRVKRPSLGNRIKESVMRSMVRPAMKVPVRPVVPAEPSFVRPARLRVKETDLKPKSADAPKESTTAS